MALNGEWDAQKMLDLYLYDYMIKNNKHEAAEIFRREAGFSPIPVALNSRRGFLHEWWSVFYDIYNSSQTKYREDRAQQAMQNQPQNMHPAGPQVRMNQSQNEQFLVNPELNRIVRQPCPSPLATNNYEEPLRHLSQYDFSNMQHGLCDQPQQPTLRPDKSPMQTQYHQRQFDAESRAKLLAERLSHMPRNYAYADPGSLSKMVNHNLTIPMSNQKEQDSQAMVTRQIVVQTRQNTEQNQEQYQLQWKPLPAGCSNTQINKPVDESVELYFSNNDHNAEREVPPSGNLGHGSSASDKDYKGLTFKGLACLHSNKSKVLCSHFSSNGKLLASAGQEKKVLIWYTETLDYINTSEVHSALITDVRFRSNSNVLATSSFDRTVQIWDTTLPIKPLAKLLGHSDQVKSLDFHPTRTDLLSSCDSNNEIRYWNTDNSACIHVSKGATKQVRFQDGLGQLLATAVGNLLYIIDIEMDTVLVSLEGHEKEISSICWDPTGKNIASVSEDSARVWSPLTGSACIHKLLSNGNKFRSCTLHPANTQCLVIGGYKTIELWDPAASNGTITVEGHEGLVSSLSYSQEARMVASTSHDQCVKLWK